jgi:hypothetical protein
MYGQRESFDLSAHKPKGITNKARINIFNIKLYSEVRGTTPTPETPSKPSKDAKKCLDIHERAKLIISNERTKMRRDLDFIKYNLDDCFANDIIPCDNYKTKFYKKGPQTAQSCRPQEKLTKRPNTFHNLKYINSDIFYEIPTDPIPYCGPRFIAKPHTETINDLPDINTMPTNTYRDNLTSLIHTFRNGTHKKDLTDIYNLELPPIMIDKMPCISDGGFTPVANISRNPKPKRTSEVSNDELELKLEVFKLLSEGRQIHDNLDEILRSFNKNEIRLLLLKQKQIRIGFRNLQKRIVKESENKRDSATRSQRFDDYLNASKNGLIFLKYIFY